MSQPTVLRHRYQSRRERRTYFLLALFYCVAAAIRGVYELAHGNTLGDIAPGVLLRVVFVGLILLLVVKYRDSAGVADGSGVRGFAQKNVVWTEVEAVETHDDEAVLVLNDGTKRRTRFPATFAEQLAQLGGKPLR